MMKHTLILILSTIVLFISNGTYIYAKDIQSPKLFLSPSFKILSYSKEQKSITDSITVTNGFKTTINVKIDSGIAKIINGNISIIKNTNLANHILLNRKKITLKPQQSLTVPVVIKDPYDFIDQQNPIVTVQAVQKSINSKIDISPQITSVFMIEDVKSIIDFDLQFDIQKSSIIDPNFKLTGTITNTGERVIKPSGTVNIYKQSDKLKSIELSSDIYSPLLPGESISFERHGELNFNNYISNTGQFQFELEIKPNPFSNSLKVSKSIYHFNKIIFIILIITIIFVTTLTVLLIFTIQNKKIINR